MEVFGVSVSRFNLAICAVLVLLYGLAKLDPVARQLLITPAGFVTIWEYTGLPAHAMCCT